MGAYTDERSAASLAVRCARDPLLRARAVQNLDRLGKERLLWNWDFWGRQNQLLTLVWAWTVWVICAGRGWGKSRTGAEAVRTAVERYGCRRIALVARTAADARDVMVEGESGLLSISPPWNRPRYERSKRRLTWPNGAIATLYSADNPDQLRGPQHDFAWCDELAAWRYVEESWDNLVMGLRLLTGLCRVVVTTTPRPIAFLRQLLEQEGTLVTYGSTFDNLSNLHANVRANLLRYKGTNKEQQELFGRMLTEIEGALIKQSTFDKYRITDPRLVPKLRMVAMGVDPTLTATKDSDACGIVVGGLGGDGHTYKLEDGTQTKKMPEVWAQEIVRLVLKWGVNVMAVEKNAGRELIELTVRNAFKLQGKAHRLPRIIPLTSTEDKGTRAEPVAVLNNIGMVHHVGHFAELETEWTTWVPNDPKKKSPNRIDADVFMTNELNPNSGRPGALAPSQPTTDYRKILMPKGGFH